MNVSEHSWESSIWSNLYPSCDNVISNGNGNKPLPLPLPLNPSPDAELELWLWKERESGLLRVDVVVEGEVKRFGLDAADADDGNGGGVKMDCGPTGSIPLCSLSGPRFGRGVK